MAVSVLKRTFIRNYTKAISEGYAAIFAGAGLSKSSGYVNWKDLLRPLADDIGLDVDKEHDLLSVAQYYTNQFGTRNQVNEHILSEFTKETIYNENINILTRLPISTYWTTNYDELIEEGLKKNNRNPDVKRTQENLSTNKFDRDAVIYKMHGDIHNASKAVLIKDDYETYELTHSLFTTALKGDLVSKTFLFIGFSFEDPNLNSILGRMKALLGKDIRDHYCFFEVIKYKGNKEEYAYNKAKQELIIKDLSRYGIQAILLDSYSEITDILRDIEIKCNLRNIFISSSLAEAKNIWTNDTAIEFCHSLSKALVHNNFRITSGFGNLTGSAIINGALEEIMNSKYKHIDEHLRLRPFPQVISGNLPKKVLWKNYRKDMIQDCGVSIFMFGNKHEIDNNNELVLSDGMLEEYDISKSLGKKIIPVGSTGGATKVIFDKIKKDINSYPYLKEHLNILENEKNPKRLIKTILNIIKQFN